MQNAVQRAHRARRRVALANDQLERERAADVPLARREIAMDAPTLRYVLNRMDVRCPACQALH